MARDWRFFVVGFALFIVACGATHLLDVITTWIPIFWVDASIVILTAVLSAYSRRSSSSGAPPPSPFPPSTTTQASLSTAPKIEKQVRCEDKSPRRAASSRTGPASPPSISHEIGNPSGNHAEPPLPHPATPKAFPRRSRRARRSSPQSEATRILTISRSSLSFFRHSTAPEPTDLGAVAESVRFLLLPGAQKSNVNIDIQASGDLTIDAIPGETRQVLLNLVRNACEASMANGKTVTIILAGRPGEVEIIVADGGVGVPPEMLGTLFEFGRSSKGEKGNGLGLWTVKHILDKHHANIHVDSRRDEGTRFTIQWPRTYVPAEAPELITAHA